MVLDGFVVGMVVAGIAIFGVVVLTELASEHPVSLPMVYVLFGAVAFAVAPALPAPDPIEFAEHAERLTELGVIVALMGAGLKIDRPPGWPGWSSTARMLAIAMPLSIAGTVLFGWIVGGLVLPTALLLGAVIAPTDPVLAAEVQVEEPGESTDDGAQSDTDDTEDEVRFALTSEAGLNDGLAFPFTYLAVLVALVGYDPGRWIGELLLFYVAYKILVGVVVGAFLGWAIAKVAFGFSAESELAGSLQGLEAIAGTLVVYGVVELLGGYGFIGIFVAAVMLREYERQHDYNESLHGVAEMVEYLLMVTIMILFGGALVNGLLAPLTWGAALAAIAIVFLVRPLAGVIALLGFDRGWRERAVISFFGIRGIGSFYYLSYGLNTAPFRGGELLWALVGLVVLISVVVHGVTATPAIAWISEAADEERIEEPESSETGGGAEG